MKATIRLYEVPTGFREQAHDIVYICKHFYSKVVDRTKIPIKEIGFLSDHPGDAYPGVLCLDCEKLPNVRFEILPWPIQRGRIEERSMFKDIKRVNSGQWIFTSKDHVGLKPAERTSFLPNVYSYRHKS